jgi:Protein of unknown function (DUF3618)
MTKKTGQSGTPYADELREQVQHTREELGETVAQLAAKADLKKRAHGTLEAAGAAAHDTAAHTVQIVHDHTPQPVQDAAAKVVETGRRNKPAAAVAAVVATLAAVTTAVLRRRKTN